MLAKRAPFGNVTYEMGVLAHLVADVEFPLSASDADPREPLYRDAYRQYIEKMLNKIPFVLDREPPPALEKNDLRGFVRDIARRAVKNYALIGPAFKDDGTRSSPALSTSARCRSGIASLSYSHATSDIAWIWRHLWVSINGDMHGTPFLGAPPPEKVQVPPRRPKPKRAHSRPRRRRRPAGVPGLLRPRSRSRPRRHSAARGAGDREALPNPEGVADTVALSRGRRAVTRRPSGSSPSSASSTRPESAISGASLPRSDTRFCRPGGRRRRSRKQASKWSTSPVTRATRDPRGPGQDLHPKVHGGILADLAKESHRATWSAPGSSRSPW